MHTALDLMRVTVNIDSSIRVHRPGSDVTDGDEPSETPVDSRKPMRDTRDRGRPPRHREHRRGKS